MTIGLTGAMREKHLELLREAGQLCDQIRERCVSTLHPRRFGRTDSTEYKIESTRQYLLHRTLDLGVIARGLLSDGHLVPGTVLSRAVMETAAVMYELARLLSRVPADADVSSIDEEVERMLLPDKMEGSTGIDPVNILNRVDSVTKEFEGFRKLFDQLCEFAHPNWSGCMGGYSRFEEDGVTIALGPLTLDEEKSENPLSFALTSLNVALVIADMKHREIGHLLGLEDDDGAGVGEDGDAGSAAT